MAPAPMVAAGEVAQQQSIQWRAAPAPNRFPMLIAAPVSGPAKPVASRRPQSSLRQVDGEEWLILDQSAPVRGSMIDILV